jgi:hypothetical protein
MSLNSETSDSVSLSVQAKTTTSRQRRPLSALSVPRGNAGPIGVMVRTDSLPSVRLSPKPPMPARVVHFKAGHVDRLPPHGHDGLVVWRKKDEAP